MTVIDIIILVVLGAGAVRGFMKGFVKQFSSLVGLVAGLLAAKALYMPFAAKLCPAVTQSATFAQCLAFILIWIAVPLAFSLIASLLTRTLEAISLGWLNRFAGAGLGILKYMLLAGLLINVLQYIDADNQLISGTKKQESALYYPMEKFTGMFFPAIKKVAQQYI